MCIRVILHQKQLQAREGPGYYQAVKVASIAQLPLQDLQSVDGVILLSGDRILVKDQSTNSDNGIYITNEGEWKRAKDMSKDSQVIVGCTVFVQQGHTHGGSTMVLESVSSDIMGKYGISKSMTFMNQLYQTLGRAGEEGDILIADPSSANGVRWEAPDETKVDEDPIPDKRTIIIKANTVMEEIIRLSKESSTVRFVLITPGNHMHHKTIKCSVASSGGSVSITSTKAVDPKKLIDIRDGQDLRAVVANGSDEDWEFRVSIS